MKGRYFDIVLTSPQEGAREQYGEPDHTFVEIEDDKGNSIEVGEWVMRPDGFLAIRIPIEAIGELYA